MSTNDPSRTVSYLNNSFRRAIDALRQSSIEPKDIPDKIKAYEIEFAYLIDEIERGPAHFVTKKISDTNRLIGDIESLAGIPSELTKSERL